MIAVTNNLAKNPKYTPPDMVFDQVLLNYFSDEDYCTRDDLKTRWEFLCEQDIQAAKEQKKALVVNKKESEDLLGAMGNARAQRIFKRVGAKLFNKEVMKCLETWKDKVDDANGWGIASMRVGIS